MLTRRKYDKARDKEITQIEPFFVILFIIVVVLVVGSITIKGAGRGPVFDSADQFGRERR